MGLGRGHTGYEMERQKGKLLISASIVVSTEGIGESGYAGLGLASLINFSRPRA